MKLNNDDIVGRLDASIRYDAHNGDAAERNVCKQQAVEAIAEINQLRGRVHELVDLYAIADKHRAELEIEAYPAWTCPACGGSEWQHDVDEKCSTRWCADCSEGFSIDHDGYPRSYQERVAAADTALAEAKATIAGLEQECDELRRALLAYYKAVGVSFCYPGVEAINKGLLDNDAAKALGHVDSDHATTSETAFVIPAEYLKKTATERKALARRVAGLEEAIMSFALQDESDTDGQPCFCRSSGGNMHNQHSDRCVRVRAALAAKEGQTMSNRPEIVCLCGSTRFRHAFESANERLTLTGCIVLAPGCFQRSTEAEAQQGIFKGCTPEQKVSLDELHKRKIDIADRVLVLNVGGYIGSSTRSEIEYATAHGKPVEYLEPAHD